jgi:hypothetical protein
MMSAIICSGTGGLIMTSRVGGGASDFFGILGGFCVFPSIFSKICFFAKTDFGVENRP